jgi:YaiO family outer membrane protein
LIRLAALACVAAVLLQGLPVAAACSLSDQAERYTQVDTGASNASVSHGNLPWREQFLQAVVRDGNARSAYVRVASDQRFGHTDPSYEGGVYDKLASNVIADLVAGFSPTHAFSPASILGGGVDVRAADGYGVQAQYVERAYTAQNAGITTLGADRYAGQAHFDVAVTGAVLSNVPGTALSERIGYDRSVGCDQESVTVSAGRDVESTGVGTNVAVYQAYSYNASDTHWMNPHLAWQAGAGWDVLVGAYSRFEIRISLRERL